VHRGGGAAAAMQQGHGGAWRRRMGEEAWALGEKDAAAALWWCMDSGAQGLGQGVGARGDGDVLVVALWAGAVLLVLAAVGLQRRRRMKGSGVVEAQEDEGQGREGRLGLAIRGGRRGCSVGQRGCSERLNRLGDIVLGSSSDEDKDTAAHRARTRS
jgi:hypothetical protein